jgi:hypothetical protein
MRRADGQASIEWMALIAVVALVLGGAAALTYGGLGAKVAWAYRRGICAVTLERCPREPMVRADLPPCPVHRSNRSQDVDVRLGFIDLGGGVGVQEETTSDGRVTVTFTNSGAGGVIGGIGASFQLGPVKAGAEAAAQASVKFTAGKSWTFPDRAAADAFVKRYGADQQLARHVLDDARKICFFCGMLGIGSVPVPPTADETYSEGGLDLKLGGDVSAVWGGTLGGELAGAIGHRDDRATGEQTFYLRLNAGVSGDVFLSAGLGALGGSTGLAQLTLDRHGEPESLELEAVTSHAVLNQAPVKQGAGQSSPQVVKNLHGAGKVTELEIDLDLKDPANAAAANRLLKSWGGGVRNFVRWTQAHGVTTMRTFSSADGRGGAGATLALVAEVGGGYTHSSQDLRLTGVFTRLPGLGFLPRADCLVQ